MPVPDFDHNGVLPPHLGNPVQPNLLSPYPVSSFEVCAKLGGTPERRAILQGLLSLREHLRNLGFTDAFQWLDGSFMEDCESVRGRPPGDIDVVTFAKYPQNLTPSPSLALIRDRMQTKATLHVDHIIVNLEWPGVTLVEHTRYWGGLFAHRRSDGVWKGMVRLELDTIADDLAAGNHLNTYNLAP